LLKKFIHGQGFKKECLIEKELERIILDFHIVQDIATMIYWENILFLALKYWEKTF